MTPENHRPRPSVDPLIDLLEAMLPDASAANVSSEIARAVRALRHAAEYTVMAAEMLLEEDRSGRIVSPEQALEWATIKLSEVWDGASVLSPAPWPENCRKSHYIPAKRRLKIKFPV